jgi:alpha-beta hydrolase superfamily lysophospholipase
LGEEESQRAAGIDPAGWAAQPAGINSATGGTSLRTFRASDGYSFYYRHYPSSGAPKARLVFVHGIRSHGGWYERSCRRFAESGFEVDFLDRRGAGLNTAHRGDSPNFRRLLDDVAEFVQQSRRERGSLPIVLGGISWGGKLAVGLPYRKPGLIDGLMLLCPGLVPIVAPPFTARVRIAAARALRPWKFFPIPLNEPQLFTASPEWQSYIETEPLGLRQVTARFLFSSFSLDIYLKRAAKRVNLPTLLLLGGQDRIISNAGTRAFMERFGSKPTIIEYPGTHHTLEFEASSHPWIDNVIEWLLVRFD